MMVKGQPKAYEKNSSSRNSVAYDSTTNINDCNLSTLVGQSIYFIPNNICERKGHYDRLALSTILPDEDIDRLSDDFSGYIYKPITVKVGPLDLIYTSYSEIKGKSFEITAHIPKIDKRSDYLVLRSSESDKNIFMECKEPLLLSPFIVINGYYAKLKSQMAGKYCPYNNMVIKKYDTAEYDGITESDTLTCVDVSFVDDRYNPEILLLQSKSGQLYCFPYKDFKINFKDIEEDEKWHIEIEKAQRAREKQMTAKYGKINGNLIANGKVKIGFTKDMCIDAWGEPQKINKTMTKMGTSEQWIYWDGSAYLYFEKGRLSAIQN